MLWGFQGEGHTRLVRAEKASQEKGVDKVLEWGVGDREILALLKERRNLIVETV